jgi:hypothetical protein
MFGLLIDAALIGIIIAVMEGGDFPGWLPALGCAVVISLGTYVIQLGLVEVIGSAGAWLGIVLGALLGGVVISALCGMSVKRAAIAASIFLGVKIVIGLAFVAMAA